MDDLLVINTYLETHASPCFSLLYDRYFQLISRRCISLLGNEADAKDAAQEIMIKIMTNLARFKMKSSFSTWVYSITYNFCMDRLRKRKRQPNMEDEFPEIGEEDPIPDEEIYNMEIKALNWVMKEISSNDKAVLLMKYHEGMSIKEIGEVLGKADSAVKMQLKRAKERARDLRDEYFRSQEPETLGL
jgi:RNA polymerase sigma-70 factor (ECF subfamily)